MQVEPTQVGGVDAVDVNNDRGKATEQLEQLAAEQHKRKHPLGAAGSVGCARGRISRANGRASPVDGTGTGEFLS